MTAFDQQMTNKGIAVLWVCGIVSLLASIYLMISFQFYAWLDATRHWPTEKAAIWAYSSLALCVIFFIVFIVCVVKAVRATNENFRKTQSSE